MKDIACVRGSLAGREDGVKITDQRNETNFISAVLEKRLRSYFLTVVPTSGLLECFVHLHGERKRKIKLDSMLETIFYSPILTINFL